MALLKVEDLKVHFPIKGGVFGRTLDYVRAVDGVSFELQPRNVRNRWGIRERQINNWKSDYALNKSNRR